jgi:hypothetical protein
MKRCGYAYSIVRYVHDVISGESLNIAVALFEPVNRRLEFRYSASLLRVKQAFPDANTESIKNAITSLERNLQDCLVSEDVAGIGEAFALILPPDESSIQISKTGAGVTTDLAAAADEMLERFVLRCDFGFDDLEIFENSSSAEGIVWGRRVEVFVPASSNDNYWQDESQLIAERA